jgi:hypothetical protein
MINQQLDSCRGKRLEHIDIIAKTLNGTNLSSVQSESDNFNLKLACSVFSMHNSMEHMMGRIDKIKRYLNKK